MFRVPAFLAVLAAVASVALPARALVIDFSAGDDGGFMSSGAPEWIYTGVQWQTPGAASATRNALTSPNFIASRNGGAISIVHAYDFEKPDDFFDGGRLGMSVNGGAFVTLTPDGGYPTAKKAADGCDELDFAPCWSGRSGGFVTDRFTLPDIARGDVIALRLSAAWDFSVAAPSPNWKLRSVSLDFVSEPAPVPLPGALPLLGAALSGLAGLACAGRRPPA